MIYNDDSLSFKILTVKHFFHKEGFFDVKARPYASFSFRISGTSTLETGNKTLITKPGDLLFIPSDTSYKVEYSLCEIIVVHLEQCNYLELESISPQNRTAIEHRFQHLLESWNERHSINQAKSIIYDILEKIAIDKGPSSEHTAFANSVRYINEHFCDPDLNIETICQELFMSASSLQRAFKSFLGISPKQYLDKQRMNKALELLTEDELSVNQIAYACGYTDEKYFSRVFKKTYGYPPSQLRKHIDV